ncbi:88ee55e3-7759-4024-a49e-dd0ac489dc56 [Sclerotinia trifoliorum]|uniref:88ee55e3-7759-4024-a49e-dd0ac489dc56 n=1 Tax=Sclerotinia trifoliorum TaxID=28548 RepID=A0A8H2VTW1_9HELO|nr:88ee55e3-7759-4024-a49e-dd0ac489dc56 [Sclerotinia trifoliorum]
MVAIKNVILFISAVSAAAISRRTPATILSDITTIDTNVNALTNAVKNYNGGFFGLISVSSTESTLENSIKNAATDASNTSPLSSADSENIFVEIDNLKPDINEALNALVEKKSTFASAGVDSTVASDLANLKKETDAFGKALLAIFSSDVKQRLTADLDTIDTFFTNAQAQF